MVGMQRTTAGFMQCLEGLSRKIPYPDIREIHKKMEEDESEQLK